MFDFLKDIGNYDSRKVARTDVAGVTISTAYTSDEGYETAVIDKNGVHPVERYKDKEAAVTGHEMWVKDASNLTTITQLGLSGWSDAEEIELVRDLVTD